MGDFNVVKTHEEKLELSFNQGAVDAFSDFIESLGLIDLPLLGGSFSWCSNMEVATFCQLDRFLIALEILISFADLVQRVWPRSLSDHNPITLELEKKNWGPSLFKLYFHWLDFDGFNAMVKTKWDFISRNREVGEVWSKLKDLKVGIKEWAKANGNSEARDISSLEAEIQSLEIAAFNNDC